MQISSALTHVCRESETPSTLVPLPNYLPLTWPFTCGGEGLASGLPHSLHLPRVPTFTTQHLSQCPYLCPFFCLSHTSSPIFSLATFLRRTSLVQFFNSRHEVKQILDSKSGHVGSSPRPASYWPRPLLLSHRDSEESTYSVLIILRIKQTNIYKYLVSYQAYVGGMDFTLFQRDMVLSPYTTKPHHSTQFPSDTTGTSCNFHLLLYPTTSHSSPWPSLSSGSLPSFLAESLKYIYLPKQARTSSSYHHHTDGHLLQHLRSI